MARSRREQQQSSRKRQRKDDDDDSDEHENGNDADAVKSTSISSPLSTTNDGSPPSKSAKCCQPYPLASRDTAPFSDDAEAVEYRNAIDNSVKISSTMAKTGHGGEL